MTQSYAVIAITKNGVRIARRILSEWTDVDVYCQEKFTTGDEEKFGIHFFQGSIMESISDLFHAYRGLICIISLGAVVRMIAPLLQDKKTDPAIVVIDDGANHVISVLSGHLGGANRLTSHLANLLGSRPVITTASDVGNTITVDLLGQEFGFEIESFEQVTKVSAAVINGQTIHVIQEAGEEGWWPDGKPLPPNVHRFRTIEQSLLSPFDAALLISPRLLSEVERSQVLGNGVIYRPKVLVVGIGCNRGTPADEIEEAIQHVLQQANLSTKSVRNLATIDVKGDEEGILEVCKRHHWKLDTFTAVELNQILLPNPSEVVYKYVGAYGVSEPAARLSSGANEWLVEKVKHGNVTISVCVVSGLEGCMNETA